METKRSKLKSAMLLLALFLSVVVFTMPFVVGFPNHVGNSDITPLLLSIPLACGVGVFSFAAMQAPLVQFRALKLFGCLALVSLIASKLLGLDIQFPVIGIPTPHILAPLLRVDGEYAYDADVLEIYCELWIATGAVLGLLYVIFKGAQFRRKQRPLTLTLSPTSRGRGNGLRS